MVRSAKSPPRTPTASKRILSSSSNSPLHEDKKSKTYSSPNRFAVLSSIDTCDDTGLGSVPSIRDDNVEMSTHSRACAELHIPPIHISNISNFSALKDALINITTDPNGFTCKSTSSYLIVQPSSLDNFNAIVRYLMNINASFHTFLSRSKRPLRIVIRNLHHSTLSADISDALLEEGHIVRQVYNVKNKKYNHPFPIFFVDLECNDNNNQIYNITSLLNTKVIIEKPNKSSNGPPQCFKCQDYGHTQRYCHHPSRCVKCGEAHKSSLCTKDRSSPAKCVHCSEDHTANFRGCPFYQAILNRHKIKSSYSQNNASQTKNLISESLPNEPSQSIPSYASVTAGTNPNINPHISNLNSALSKFLSDLTSIINSFLSGILINK